MDILASQVGIDSAKDTLDVSVGGAKPSRVTNTLEGCRALAARLPRPSVVHVEASGGYERLVARVLRAEGFEVRVHDPLRVRRMAQARAGKAKTDPIDAKNLATTGALLPVRPSKSLEREGLADHSRAVEELKRASAQFLTRARAAELDPAAKAAYLEAAKGLREQAEALQRRCEERLEASSLAGDYWLARSVPGVGPCSARVCVCELPESLEGLSPAQAASYAGLAPIDDSSGRRTGKSRLKRGNARLKAAWYMPAVSALRHQPWARELYARLKAKGRLHQQAMVAVMRRLLVRVAAVLKRGSPWQDEPPRA